MEIGFSRKSIALIVGLLFVLSASFAFGQGIVTGSTSGTVEDQQHAVISGAKITATNNATNQQFTTESNSQGYFAVRGLPVGTYTVTIEAPKFARVKVNDVVVNSNRDTALGGRTLSIGTSELVTVEETAPLVESNSIQIANSFSSKKVTDLPVNSGVDQLAYLVPGVVPTGDLAFGNNNGASFSANGQRGRSTNFQIDGQGNNDNSVTGPQLGVTNPDTIAEFQVTTNYTAEYGRNLGSIINIVTKSGTNSIHGTVSEFHTNQKFQSFGNQDKSPFNGFCPPGVNGAGPDGIVGNADDTCAPVKKPQFIENRYGFTLGGPIVKDHLWAFGSYQGDRAATSATFNSGFALAPTPAGIATLQAAYPGNPAVTAITAFGPQAYPGATFANTQLKTVSNGVTPANVEFGSVSRRISQPFHEHEWGLRGDWQATQKDRVSVRWLRQANIFTNVTASATPDFAAGQFVDVPAVAKQIAADWSRSFTSRFINQFRFSYGKLQVSFENGSNPGCTNANPSNCPFHIGFSDPTILNLGLGVNLPQGRGVNNYQYQDNATYQLGKHSLKFGGEFGHQNAPSPFLPRFNGDFTFPSFNRLLQNTPSRFRMVDGPFSNTYKEDDVAGYFQDDWRVKDNLTLNLGLRWEWQEQAINLLHDQSVAKQLGSTPFWDTTLPIQATTVPKFDQDLNNFGPVFGFAWTPRFGKALFGEDKTVIRGGYAIKYDPAFYNIFLNVSTSAPAVNLGDLRTPTAVPPGIPAGAVSGTDVRNALLSALPVGQDPRLRSQTQVANGFHNPYTQQWSLGVQRQVSSKVAAELRYVGNHTIGQFQTINGNVALNPIIANGFDGSVPGLANVIPAGITPCSLFGTPGFALGYQDCNFRNVALRANTSFSIYHALQSRLEFQNWHGLTANASYTYSRVIDNASEIFSTFAGGQGIVGAQNPFDTNRGERGVAGQDFPHVFSMAFTYDLPWMRNQQGVIGHILGGWQANTTFRHVSGQPWTPLQFAGTSTSCDPTGSISAVVDTCRPILSNSSAALNTVGQLVDTTSGQAVDIGNPVCFDTNGSPVTGLTTDPLTGQTCSPAALSAFHWLLNDDTAGQFFGNPYLGVGRNTQRGEPINALNFGIFKNTKLNERVSLQFQANAYNLLNRQYRGVPDAFVQDIDNAVRDINPLTGRAPSTFGNTFANPSGNFNTNSAESGIGVRRLIFGLKLIF